MPRGGARPRSGPPADPNSGRSDRNKRAAKKAAASGDVPVEETDELPITSVEFNPTALPARGRAGEPPVFPLPKVIRWNTYVVDKVRHKELDEGATEGFREREIEIWVSEWRKPQAVAWEREPWRWDRIALYCRLTTVIEAEPDSNATLISRQRELAIEHGLTPDGMRINGWAIAPDQLAAQRATKAASAAPSAPPPLPPLRLQPPG